MKQRANNDDVARSGAFEHPGFERSLGKWVDRMIRFDVQHLGLKLFYRAVGARRYATRTALASQLSGDGIEIGALHNPLEVSRDCRVTYVDRLTTDELRQLYPELADSNLVPVGAIGVADCLQLPAGSQDFVIANHLIEHTEDPIAALREWHRVLKPNGLLFLAVPHYEGTFDAARPLTGLRHLFRDHQDGGLASRFGHYGQWAEHVNGLRGGIEKLQRTRQLLDQRYPIHFHVWDEARFLAFFLAAQLAYGCRFKLEAHVSYEGQGDEFVLLCRRA